jgi:CheY-like chemotaxis protein
MSALMHPRFEGRRILFADDDQQLRDLFTAVLTEAGFEVHAANNGVDAFNLLKESERDYDVLVTDNDMPGLDGVSLVTLAREERFPGKIIVMSGGLSPANLAAFTALEVDRILAKPVNGRALIGAIQES